MKNNRLRNFEEFEKMNEEINLKKLNPFRKKDVEDDDDVNVDDIKKKVKSTKKELEDKLQEEADEKFPVLIKKLNSKIKESEEGEAEVKQNPFFCTKSSDGPNHYLIDKVIKHFKDKGFKTDKSYDGRDNAKHDWVRIWTP